MFGTVLKNLRIEKGLTQIELANALNISRSTIGMYEQGKREPNLETQEKIARFFGVSIDYLISGNNTIDFQAASGRIFTFANSLDMCLAQSGWSREWDDERGKYAFRRGDVCIYFSDNEYAELAERIEKTTNDIILAAIQEKIIKK